MASSSRGGPIVTTVDYLKEAETLRRRELVWGVVREAPGPEFGHQSSVTDLTTALNMHVHAYGLGRVCVSPVDVILDEPAGLVVQPDIVFISNERLGIIRQRIWGAPDLAIEILSPGTKTYDRRTKLDWY